MSLMHTGNGPACPCCLGLTGHVTCGTAMLPKFDMLVVTPYLY